MFGIYSIIIISLEAISFYSLRLVVRYDHRFNRALDNLIQFDHYKDKFLPEGIVTGLLRKFEKMMFCFNLLYHFVYAFLLCFYIYLLQELIF